jgi:hypothetical protein
MATQHHGQSIYIDEIQNFTNLAVSVIFFFESILKIFAFGKQYFLQLTNWFDLLIIILSLIDLSIPSINGLSIFRSFRLVRLAWYCFYVHV